MNNDLRAIDRLRKAFEIIEADSLALCARGIVDPGEARDFLKPDVSQLRDPFSFADMHDAVSAVKHTIAAKGKFAYIGDYDADGISCKRDPVQNIEPDGREGGSISSEPDGAWVWAYNGKYRTAQGISLLITVDCGITSTQEIERARKWA